MKKNKGLVIRSTELVYFKKINLPVLHTSDIGFAFDGLLTTFYRNVPHVLLEKEKAFVIDNK
jgi:hypothetical protein